MGDSSPPPDKPPSSSTPPPAHGGIDISGGDVRAGHDIVGGDVIIGHDQISGQNIRVEEGYSAAQVQRLVMIVGGLVFATAACFFIFGAISAAAIVGALNSPQSQPPNVQAAQSMQAKIDHVNNQPPGASFDEKFTETEISSYFHYVLGPNAHVSNGKARLLDTPGEIALGGNLDDAGGLPFLAQIKLTTDEVPIELQGAWIKILPTPEGVNFGWIPVTPFAQGFASRLNGLLFGRAQFTDISQLAETGVGVPALRVLGNTR